MSLKTLLSNSPLVTCEKSTTGQEVASLMQDNDVGSVLVLEGKKPVGIITDRDLVLRCMALAKDVNVVTASDLMSTPLETVPENASIHDVITAMCDQNIRRICILNAAGVCTGIISSGDVVELLARQLMRLAEGICPQEEKLLGAA